MARQFTFGRWRRCLLAHRNSQERMPGTNIPGVLTAGTFYQDGKRVFWDVHNPENTVVIELKDERYNELIVEVAVPQAAVELVRAALPG
jgi:hypothetical protein